MKTSNKTTRMIMLSMVLGVAVGYLCHRFTADAAAAKELASYFSLVTDAFLRLIKMIIAPLVFATIVSGIAGMDDTSAIGRIGVKALLWFLMASLVSLAIGLLFVNLTQPGIGLSLPLPAADAATGLKTSSLNFKEFFTGIFPKNFFEAMSTNSILQILVFSVFFGVAVGKLPSASTSPMKRWVDNLMDAMLHVTNAVMMLAPIGIFAALAAAVTVQGLDVLLVYGRFIGYFYLALLVLWALLFAAGFAVLKGRAVALVRLIREPIVIAFSTASSEAAYPSLIERLREFGIRKRMVGFMLPLGYSFNLDGSMVYQAFAAVFIAQAFDVHMSLGQQITMLLILMVSSKGMAAVPRGSLVVVAAILPMFGLPESGLLLIMGIDQFLDMGRTATNVLGNSIATAVVAKWEGEYLPEGATEEDTAVSQAG
ncbi:Na+/H+-dicarboxylate symporter [Herbaspirillum sp. Sphag1AN]|uniref:dicarboxylate/amino acid:cation symporter n=1 Tax=unclassified Herbaspirillum TaxID=2624150 RepID=UPI0016197166|nr:MULTISPECIES: dicarboxylate/amino acid:cation symporter [unclassified Herbaspirillum]MBB3213488.1 Na+/H+-dicarboxylate symporter [Herbaspirillum sp. Sphag1AN]MBB3246686.1 Na+/H+-dicarboxylate symporter [Herbaspirillum sp. Sphag64]